MADTIEAKVTHRFKASPERVYDAFLDPVKVQLWQKAWGQQSGTSGEITACEIDPVVGGKFLFADMREEGEARHWGSFTSLDRPTKIAFTWFTDPSEESELSLVTLIIEPEPDGPGAIVTLYHEMGAQWSEWIAQTEKGWITMLFAIDGLLLAEG
jgi:uncharacterized protein YndB with AHSA1/START domain